MNLFQCHDIELLASLSRKEAYDNLWAYRQYINSSLVKGWWQRDFCYHLQQFFEDLKAGKRPLLVVQAPPQHGKSFSVYDAIAWIIGHEPSLKIGYASFSDMLGSRANLYIRKTISSSKYFCLFPEIKLPSKNDFAVNNLNKVEWAGKTGFFRNTTVGGAITGEPLDLGIIDDPIKSREEANSKTVREKTWQWYTDDFDTRLSEKSGVIFVMTRWHSDDPVGKLLLTNTDRTNIKVLSYPAIATEDEHFRLKGEPLFPEFKSLNFLEERRAKMSSYSWMSLYQQNPMPAKGKLVQGSMFKRYNLLPPLQHRLIFCDTAQKTKTSSDYTVFQCWGLGKDNCIYLIDLVRKKLDAVDLLITAVEFWNKHNYQENGLYPANLGVLRKMYVEDAVSGTGLIQRIKRNYSIPIEGIIRTKDKYTRFCDILGYIEAGFVAIPSNASFNHDFIDECEKFTEDDTHEHDDQVDPMMDAIQIMLVRTKYSLYDSL